MLSYDYAISAPFSGRLIKLSEVADNFFSSEAIGKGIAIEPTEGKLFAPFDGIVKVSFPTKHAIGLISDSGIVVLIHVGMDTVKLNGKYFVSHVYNGQKIKRGDLLLEFDIDRIKKSGYKIVTPIVVINTDDYRDIVVLARSEEVYSGDFLLDIKK